MKNKEVRKKWPELKKKLLEKYPHLTEQDLIIEIGKEKELMVQLQDRLEKNWKEIKYMLSLLG